MESFPVALNIKLTNLPLPRRTRQGEVLLLLDASYGTRFHNFVDELVRIEVE